MTQIKIRFTWVNNIDSLFVKFSSGTKSWQLFSNELDSEEFEVTQDGDGFVVGIKMGRVYSRHQTNYEVSWSVTEARLFWEYLIERGFTNKCKIIEDFSLICYD